MKLTIYLAYDGSINADWVARYALNMAANGQDPQIILIHILDDIYSPDKITKKIKAIEAESAVREIKMTSRLLPLRKNVFYSLQQNDNVTPILQLKSLL